MEMIRGKSQWEANFQLSAIDANSTLLKSIPFDDTVMFEEEEIRREIETSRQFFYMSPSEIEHLKFTGVDRGPYSVRVGPVLQLISVTISNQTGNMIQIFGEISVRDDDNNVFCIYKSDPDKPEFVSSQRKDLLLQGCPMAPNMSGQLKIKLNCLVDNKTRMFKWNGHSQPSVDEYNVSKTKTVVFDGSDGCQATMVFAAVPYAVIVYTNVSLTFKSPDSNKGANSEIYGTIKINKVLCFDKKASDPVKMLPFGRRTFFGQSTYFFAVPRTLSPMQVEVEVSLRNGNGFVVADETYYIGESSRIPSEDDVGTYACKNEHYSFVVETRWILHDEFFYSTLWSNSINVKWRSSEKGYLLRFSEITDQDFLEVFSIVVGASADKSKGPLWGTILVRDKSGTDYVFARDINYPDKLEGSSMSVAWPDRCILVSDFCMHLKLKDVHGSRVCRGYFDWGQYPYTRDRRLCSFIKGEGSYFVVVHYSLFRNGKRVKLSLKWKGDLSFVYGSVFAEYINCDYSSDYDKKNYRNIIFERSKYCCLNLGRNFEIPLSKSHISAPSDCKGLIVYVNLCYRFDTNLSCEHKITEKVEFVDNGNTGVMKCGLLRMEVEWLSQVMLV